MPAQLIADGEPARPAHSAVRNLMIRKTDQMWQTSLAHGSLRLMTCAVGQRDPLMR